MKIAFAGAHQTGKSTLIEELLRSLPAYRVVDEPYRQLEEEGHDFADPPCAEDFEVQLERSIQSVQESEGDCLFDRCPADLLAYLMCVDDGGDGDVDTWLPQARDAMERLDLVVFVPIEEPDRVAASALTYRRLRRRVNDALRALVVEDRWDLSLPVLEVSGSPAQRARQVLASLGSAGRAG